MGKQHILTVKDFDLFFGKLFPGGARPERTWDGLKAGSLEKRVSKVAVSWMATMAVIEEAIKLKTDLIVHHEPLYYIGDDDYAGPLSYRCSYPVSKIKSSLLTKHDIAVYRVHDAWDFYPQYGIHDAWLEQLKGLLTPEPERDCRMSRTKPMRFSTLLEAIRKKMGLQYVLACGDVEKKVSHVWTGIGAGGIKVVEDALENNSDCLIVGEQVEWEAVRLAEDAGLVMGLVGHCASENAGMKKMVEFLRKEMPGPEYFFLDAGHPFIALTG